MPTYEYECENAECACVVEIRHSIKDDPIKTCPLCHQEKLRRNVVSGFMVMIEPSKPRTLMGVAEKNTKDALARGETPPGWEKKPTPPWRDGPLDMRVLKNPRKYIMEGKV